jgi:hypothetical protein
VIDELFQLRYCQQGHPPSRCPQSPDLLNLNFVITIECQERLQPRGCTCRSSSEQNGTTYDKTRTQENLRFGAFLYKLLSRA